MSTAFEFDVFLSHSSQDKPRARLLAQRLRAAGLRVWFDEWEIQPGDDIYLEIERGLEAARVLLLCLSPAAVGSDWVGLERSTALFRDPSNQQRRFVPVLLADCRVSDALRRYRHVDWRTDDEAALAAIVRACGAPAGEGAAQVAGAEAPPATPPAAGPATLRRGWVWWSNDESIAQGQWSVLAVAEIPLAMALFWGISQYSPWPWMTLLGLMAAPILLLRSPESVAEGVRLLRAYWAGRKREPSSTALWAEGMGSAVVAGFLAYWLAGYWLVGHSGWDLFARSALLTLRVTLVAVAVAVAGAGAVAVAGAGAVAGALFALPLLLGIVLRATLIRLWASLRFAHRGLSELPRNWWQAVCVVDLCHLPELLPNAGAVERNFTLRGLLEGALVSRNRAQRVAHLLIKGVFAPMIYLPALLYRWNLKASAMIWGPVALVLRPAFWLDEEAMRAKTSFWTTWGLLSLLGPLILGAVAWLSLAYWPKDLKELLPAWLTAVAVHFPAPGMGVRYGMLWALTLSLGGLWLAAYRIRAAHAKALEGAGDFHKGYSEDLKERFRALAASVRRWLQWNTAVAALTVWVVALWCALQRWPEDLQNVVWDWLKPLL